MPLYEPSKTPLLDQIRAPEDLRRFEPARLREIADELRYDLINAVSKTGGHLGAGLGVVELTVALHHVFDTPRDRRRSARLCSSLTVSFRGSRLVGSESVCDMRHVHVAGQRFGKVFVAACWAVGRMGRQGVDYYAITDCAIDN